MNRRLPLPILLPLIVVLCHSIGFGARDDDAVRAVFERLLADQATIWTAPVKKSTWQRKTPFVMALLSGSSLALDGSPSRRLRECPRLSGFNDLFSSNATGVPLTVFPVAVLAAGELLHRPAVTDYGLKVTRAAIGGLAVAYVLKAISQRPRPHSGKTYGFWEGGNSFPSGHSTLAWAIAGATCRHFEDHRWVPFVAYPIAGLIAFSRVTTGNHFASDAVTGSVLGWAVGYYGIR